MLTNADARNHGIYSMCTMVLKLRNLYKWDNGLDPWQEAEPAELLDWISCRSSFRHVLQLYGLLHEGQLDQQKFKNTLDNIVDSELDFFIYHEVGELLQTTFDSSTKCS